MKMKIFEQRQLAPCSCVAEIYLAVNNTAPLFYSLVSPNGQEMLTWVYLVTLKRGDFLKHLAVKNCVNLTTSFT